MKRLIQFMLVLFTVLSMSAFAQQVTIISNDFSSGVVSLNWVRVDVPDIDNGWFADSQAPSAWQIAGGVMQNNSTSNNAIGEGASVQVVSHVADTNNAIEFSFDYVVAEGDELFVHLWGLDSPAPLDANWFANFQATSGQLTDHTDRNVGLDAFNLKDGSGNCGAPSQALVVLTGSGTYTNTISIEGLDISGINGAGDFEYYLLAFARNEDGTAGDNSVDNVLLVSTYAAPPPPPTGLVWENNMDTDPISGAEPNWVVRGASSGYSIAGGLLTMDVGAWSAILDTNPYDEFQGTTKVDLEWRATSETDPAGFGAGIWCNIDGDPEEYGAIWIHAVLLSNDTQTVKITSAGDGSADIATITGLSTNMLTLHAVLDAFNQTVDYEITDGVTTASDVVSYTANGAPEGTTIGFTLFTGGPGAEVDYVRVEANATPDEVYFVTDPTALAMQIIDTDPAVFESLEMSYNSGTNLDLTITISDENYAGSFSVVPLSETNQVLFAPNSSSVEFKFDRTVHNVLGGSVATGLATFAWSEVGGGETGQVVVPLSCSVGYGPGTNPWNGEGDGASWGDADNWELDRVPGALAADNSTIGLPGYTVNVATDFTGILPWVTTVEGSSTLNINADWIGGGNLTVGLSGPGAVNQTTGAASVAGLTVNADSAVTLTGGSLSVGAASAINTGGLLDINGGTFTVDNAGGAFNFTGAGAIKMQSGTWDATATIAQIGVLYFQEVEISGGTVDLGNQSLWNTGGLTIVGDAADITMDYFNIPAHFPATPVTFAMGPTGISTIKGTGWMTIANAAIIVDGTDYAGGSGTYNLFECSNLAVTSAVPVVITGFDPGVEVFVTQDMDTDLVTLTINWPGYEGWIGSYGLYGTDAAWDSDVGDNDGENNFYEYVLGGDPTNAAVKGYVPAGEVVVDGIEYYEYVYARLIGSGAELDYIPEFGTDLVLEDWSNLGVVEVDTEAIDADYEFVTNRVDMTGIDEGFMHLIVNQL